MEKISWIDHVRNEVVLQRFKEEMIMVHKINRRRLTGLVATCVGTVF